MYYLMLAQSALHDLWHKSQKAQHDNIKRFKVFAVGAGPRFTKPCDCVSLSHQSPPVITHTHPVVSQSVFLATREVTVGSSN